MPSHSNLNNPTTVDFNYYGTDIPPGRIFVGRTFLAGAYYEKAKNEKEKKKYEFGQEFFQEIAQNELPYQKVVVTWSTLATVLAHLDSKRSKNHAEGCLQKFKNGNKYSIHYPTQSNREKALEKYSETTGDSPNAHEFVDYLCMKELDTLMYVDWDSDFQYFDDITLLPHSYWRQ